MRFIARLLGATSMTLLSSMAFAQEGERGRDDQLNIIYWQAPSILNPYLSGGVKERDASSMVLEPLANADEKGELVPKLAVEIPTVENGGMTEDLTAITWKLKEGVTWSDGTPVTAEDVKFTADYCMNPEGGCAQLSKFNDVKNVEVIDDRTITIHFDEPKPYPYLPFVGAASPILQAAQFAECTGARAPGCTEENFNPIGSGPFVVTDFRPNDSIQLVANDNYRDTGKPAFAKLNFKGGGDAVSAARAVMETGEFDYAWDLLMAPDVLETIAEGGTGKPIFEFGPLVERIEINMTNPSPDLPPETRATVEEPHPFLTDRRVRQAISMAIDRDLLNEIGYGQAGRPTCNLVPAPPIYSSDNTECMTQDLDAAKALLDEAGWQDEDGDGVREKDGMRLSIVFQTSTNAVRQDFQALIKDWWNQIGIEVELRNIDASVFFGGDPGSPDTFPKFYADVEMYANLYDGTDPQAYLAQRRCGNEPKPSTQWQGENINRFCDEEYDTLLDELSRTSKIEERARLVKSLNDIITTESKSMLPLINRAAVAAQGNTLGGVKLNAWDSDLWNVADWYRTEG